MVFLTDNLQRLNIVPNRLACLRTFKPFPCLPCLNFLLLWCTVTCGISKTDVCGCYLHFGRFGPNSRDVSLVVIEFGLL